MTEHVYEVMTEIVPEAGAEFPADMAGAFVLCFVRAPRLREAVDVAERALADEGYRLVDASHVLRLDPEDHEPSSDGHPTAAELDAVLATGRAHFGSFHCYPPDAPG